MGGITRIGLLIALVTFAAQAAPIAVGGLGLNVPSGWQSSQSALDDGTVILGFSSSNDYVTIYEKAVTGLDLQTIFVNGSTVVAGPATETHGAYTWNVISTTMSGQGSSGSVYVKGFLMEKNGKSYYGYSRSSAADSANADANAFLDGFTPATHSLTDGSFKGKKYYFGFSDAGQGAPEIMSNEALYDVKHTDDIFTAAVGGGYLGFTLVNDTASPDSVQQEWTQLQSQMTADDMYIQYSTSHGADSVIGIGNGTLTYDQIRDAVLSMPAKELIVFTMACYSGNLLDSFNNRQSDWQNFAAQGRTLLVMSSARDDEPSTSGPDTDPVDDPNGPIGSPGSAYGYALWKALIGYADGYVDGVKDGYVSLGEIVAYVTANTENSTPQTAGVYNAGLIMNRIPPKSLLESMLPTTTGKSRMDLIRVLNQLTAVR